MKWLMVIVLFVVSISKSCVEGAPQVPCFFIFGDSLADNGNNNPLPTRAKVNYSPYGIDYPGGKPTGRFTNGKTTVDILAELLGFENPIPPFATTSKSPKIIGGLNYASGAAGIRAKTGSHLGKVISLDEQLQRHQLTVLRIGSLLGTNRSQTLEYMNKCLYSVGMGSNDYINNYFMPQFYRTSRAYTPEQYAQALIDQYTHQISDLYKHGARKVALVGLGPIGCTPNAISKTNGIACAAEFNFAALLFNQKLVSLVDKLNTKLTDAKFIYVNSMGMSSGDPTSIGFKVLNVGCCPVDDIGQCVRSGTPCQNRNEYVFWDSFHPTEALNRITAFRTYTSFEPTDNYPMDVSHLVQLDLK